MLGCWRHYWGLLEATGIDLKVVWNTLSQYKASYQVNRIFGARTRYFSWGVINSLDENRGYSAQARSGESLARYGEIIGPDLNQLAVASSSSPCRVSSAQNPARHECSPTTRWSEFMQELPCFTKIMFSQYNTYNPYSVLNFKFFYRPHYRAKNYETYVEMTGTELSNYGNWNEFNQSYVEEFLTV
ncbi:hypothetical protein QL285_069668 [Trifolium repens]|nr:hypothetical protein QL285_069668 [Trifolium repens]